MALWSNKFHGNMMQQAYEFNQSITVDARLLKADIQGSIAHAQMLGMQQIITPEEAEDLVLELSQIRRDINRGLLEIDYSEEDIHSFLEAELTRRLGATGKKIHTGRSRNDQVATALKIYTWDEIFSIIDLLEDTVEGFCAKATEHTETIMPGYTHLQRAQPITFGHHLMAYAEMFMRDKERLLDASRRISNSMPLGSGALATSALPLNRFYTAELLGFERVAPNSLDAVSDRDYSIEVMNACSLIMVHVSRFAEEIILWCSQEFNYVQLDDTFSSGSSMMPQKKNPDIAELFRGKSGRVFGDLISALTIMKGIPMAYNKDIQEEKERLFDAIDTVKSILSLFPPLLEAMNVHEAVMRRASAHGFINATDCADYLASKGIPFRDAYRITGEIIQYCIESQHTLESLSLEQYQAISPLFEEDIFDSIDLDNCMRRRTVAGGPAPERVLEHIQITRDKIEHDKELRAIAQAAREL